MMHASAPWWKHFVAKEERVYECVCVRVWWQWGLGVGGLVLWLMQVNNLRYIMKRPKTMMGGSGSRVPILMDCRGDVSYICSHNVTAVEGKEDSLWQHNTATWKFSVWHSSFTRYVWGCSAWSVTSLPWWRKEVAEKGSTPVPEDQYSLRLCFLTCKCVLLFNVLNRFILQGCQMYNFVSLMMC